MMRKPQATYRLQMNGAFDFAKAKAVVAYLADLGISDFYASPIFKACRGSTHGYDVVDPTTINPELGTEADFQALLAEVKAKGMGWLQDIVPNHMAYTSQNLVLMDVLENGEKSAYYRFFDVDWQHPYENMKGRILAPFLGRFYAEALESGEIGLCYDERGLMVKYYELEFPLRTASYAKVLERGLQQLDRDLPAEHPDAMRLMGVIHFLGEQEQASVPDGQPAHPFRHAKQMLWTLYRDNERIRRHIDDNIAFYNGQPGDPASFELLDELLKEQNFRLSFWKVASEEINYRRFFTVNHLISVRVEDEDVFARMHRLPLELVKAGAFSGLRIDHIDGLYDPARYLARLRRQAGDIYVVAEKILAPGETLPAGWGIQGTTGYDFMNVLNGLFCRRENERRLNRIYQSFTHINLSFDDLVSEKKRLIISRHLAGNIDNLAVQLKTISSQDRYGRDITLYGLRRALVEVMAWFPVYRTYIDYQSVSEQDVKYLRQAVDEARRRLPGYAYELTFIEKFLLLQFSGSAGPEERRLWTDFVMNFQQYTGPLMAKGFEDTMLYIYNRLISLNEVGGSPERFGFSFEDFCELNIQTTAARRHPLCATSTHDTKRGEDVRARINVLSEIPSEWDDKVKTWARINRRHKIRVNGRAAPDANDEYFLYQTLLGAFPFEGPGAAFTERIKAYLLKAVREAKRHTAWIKPDEDYEKACDHFVGRILAGGGENFFLASFEALQKKTAFYGVLNSLSQTLLKLVSPGAADFYQGTELWDLNLVDPDNRRAVDFDLRARMLKGLQEGHQRDLAALLADVQTNYADGRIKMYLIWRALACRRAEPELFNRGAFIPLKVEGARRDHLLAVARREGQRWVLAAVPRFMTSMVSEGVWPLGMDVWSDTRVILPGDFPSAGEELFSGRRMDIWHGHLPAGELLRDFPTALLTAG